MLPVYCVYWVRLATHNDINSEGYVGITKNPRERFLTHKRRPANAHFGNAINKYGWDNLEKQIVTSELTQKEARDIERMLRPEISIGWNLAIGGTTPFCSTGYKHTDAAIAKMRGRKLNEEQLANLRARQPVKAGKLNPSFKGGIKATNVLTGEVLIINGEAEAISYGFGSGNLYACLNGRRNTHHGFKFERIVNEHT